MITGDERAKEVYAAHLRDHGHPAEVGTWQIDDAWNALSDQARRTYRRLARQRG